MEGKKKKVRLSDIAKRLNVSTVTVSKGIADREGVSDELRKKIKETAREMGYQQKKDPSLFKTDKNGLTGNIGILIPNKFFMVKASFYWSVFNSLSKELLNHNYYSIMELLSDEDEKKMMLPRIIQDKKVDGIIILGQLSESYLNYFTNKYDKFIFLDFYNSNPNIDTVSDDNFYCSYLLTSRLISMGHRKLRYVGTFNSTTSISDRFMGFAKAMLEAGLPVSKDDIINDRSQDNTFVSVKLPEELPTALVCNCDETAVKVINQLQERGISVPDDISVAGFDDFTISGTSPVPLTTIRIDADDTARVAGNLIIKKITNQPFEHGRHLIMGKLIMRESVKSLI